MSARNRGIFFFFSRVHLSFLIIFADFYLFSCAYALGQMLSTGLKTLILAFRTFQMDITPSTVLTKHLQARAGSHSQLREDLTLPGADIASRCTQTN